ncbi:hypothetical protein J1N35_034903 [Gossypium stocksii]|uniref:Zinc knuckle CX2CX4HX4C domain-containing protein n=1 Tax=Gossypium stocksii TaxID=47602 RepID=A0A9D3USW9_9ROSI|nr:hypothetical protein J1N35_034903 [Gossypium stocksii]
MEQGIAKLNLMDEEEEEFNEENSMAEWNYQYCLVGRNFIRVRVRLDVTMPLKRKKKIRIGNATMIYARFQYKKLGLFCFVCGKMRHNESFCPLRLRIEPSKFVFGSIDLERNKFQHKLRGEIDIETNSMSDLGRKDLIPKSRILNAGQQLPISGNDRWNNLGAGELVGQAVDIGPMDLMLDEENSLLVVSDGKKRQRVMEGSNGSSVIVSASSVKQSSRRVAHTFAVEGGRRHGFCSWSDGLPESVTKMAMMDRLAWLRNLRGLGTCSDLGEGSCESP